MTDAELIARFIARKLGCPTAWADYLPLATQIAPLLAAARECRPIVALDGQGEELRRLDAAIGMFQV
jgi:hypothetical protein